MKHIYKGRRLLNDRLKEELKTPSFKKAYEDADLPIRLAIEIAQLREKLGMSQQELAHKVGTKQQVISRIEKLEHTNLTLATLQKIAEALHAKLQIAFHS